MSGLRFSDLIGPISTEEFFASVFERKPAIFLPEGDQDRFSSLLSEDWLDAYIDHQRPPYTKVFAIDARRKIMSEEFATREGRIDVARLYQLHTDGATIVYRDLQDQSLMLARLCRSAEVAYGCPFFVNAYLSPPGAQCFPTHHDTNDVFVLQISGVKQWSIYQPIIELPLADQGSYEALKPDSVADTLMLTKGDLLYIPRGFPHLVSSMNEPSLHLSLSSQPYTWSDVMTRAMFELSRQDATYRKSLPRSFFMDGFDGASKRVFAHLAQRFAEMADGGPAFAAIADQFIRTRPIILPGQRNQVGAAVGLSLESKVERRSDILYMLDEGITEIRILFHDTEIKFSSGARDALMYALRPGAFRVRDLPGQLDGKDRLLLVSTLIRHGLMQVVVT